MALTTYTPPKTSGVLDELSRIDYSAMAGTPQQATSWTPLEEELSAGRLAKMLSSGSPYLEAARTKAAQASNARGLLNSSMGVQAGEQAAIEAAQPFATTDAGILANAGQYNANARNQFATAANEFARTSALTRGTQMAEALGQQRTLELQGAQLGLQGEQLAQQGRLADAEMEIKRQQLANEQTQLAQQGQQFTAQQRAALSERVLSLRQAAQNSMELIERDPNVSGEAKEAAINNILQVAEANIQETIKLSGIDLPAAWPTYLATYRRPGATVAPAPAPAPYVPPPTVDTYTGGA